MPALIMFIIYIAIGGLALLVLLLLSIFVFSRPRVRHSGANIGVNQDDPEAAGGLDHLGIVANGSTAFLYVRTKNLGDNRTIIVVPYVNGRAKRPFTYKFGGVSAVKIKLPHDVEGAYVELVEGNGIAVMRRLISGLRTGTIIAYGLLIGFLTLVGVLGIANAFEVNATALWHYMGEFPAYEYLAFLFLSMAPMYAVIGLGGSFLLATAAYLVPTLLIRGKPQKGGY